MLAPEQAGGADLMAGLFEAPSDDILTGDDEVGKETSVEDDGIVRTFKRSDSKSREVDPSLPRRPSSDLLASWHSEAAGESAAQHLFAAASSSSSKRHSITGSPLSELPSPAVAVRPQSSMSLFHTAAPEQTSGQSGDDVSNDQEQLSTSEGDGVISGVEEPGDSSDSESDMNVFSGASDASISSIDGSIATPTSDILVVDDDDEDSDDDETRKNTDMNNDAADAVDSDDDDDDDDDDQLVSFDPERHEQEEKALQQEAASPSSEAAASSSGGAVSAKQTHRSKVANEIVETERSYLSDLILARSLYLLPLKAGVVRRITAKRTALLFGNLEKLIEVNSLLYQKLSDRRKVWGSDHCLADIFVELAPMFVLYGEYCRGYGEGCELLKKLELKPDVADFLQRVGEESQAELRQLGLHDLLIMPVQRLPRYLLLLRDLLKDTDAGHPDYDNIRRAIDSIETVTKQVNESIRLAERHQKLLELERRITVQRHKVPRLIQPGRGLLREGKLGKITSRFARRGVRFFLLTDLLLYAYRIRGGHKAQCKLHYKGCIPLGSAWIRDVRDGSGYTNVFQIVAPKKTYTLFADTPQDKAAWIREINQQILALVAKDASLRSKRGDVLITGRTKHFQSVDPRYNRSPRSIRRVVTTVDDVLAPPATVAVAAPSNAPRYDVLTPDRHNNNNNNIAENASSSSVPGSNNTVLLFEGDTIDEFMQLSTVEGGSPAKPKTGGFLGGLKKRGKGAQQKGPTSLPLLELEDLNDDDNDNNGGEANDAGAKIEASLDTSAELPSTTSLLLQPSGTPKHRRTSSQGVGADGSRPSPPSSSGLRNNVVDPLSAAFNEPVYSSRRGARYDVINEATHLRTSERPPSHLDAKSTPIQPVLPSDDGCHCDMCGIQ